MKKEKLNEQEGKKANKKKRKNREKLKRDKIIYEKDRKQDRKDRLNVASLFSSSQ